MNAGICGEGDESKKREATREELASKENVTNEAGTELSVDVLSERERKGE